MAPHNKSDQIAFKQSGEWRGEERGMESNGRRNRMNGRRERERETGKNKIESKNRK